MITIQQAVSSNPDVLGGTLCFAGTRVPVRNLFDYLEGGNSIDTFLDSFSWISKDQVLVVLESSVERLEADAATSTRS